MALLLPESSDWYLITSDAVLFLNAITTVVISLCSWSLVRRHNDPARSWTMYFKIALAFFTVHVILDFCAYSLALAYSLLSYNDLYSDTDRYILFIHAHVASVDHFLGFVVDILVFLTLVNLTIDIGIIHSNKPGYDNKALKVASFTIAAIIFGLALVSFAISEYVSVEYYNYDVTASWEYQFSYDFMRLWASERQIDFSITVLVFVLALATTIWSIVVRIRTRTEKRVQTASRFLIVCCVLWLAKAIFELVYFAQYLNLYDVTVNPPLNNYVVMLQIVLSLWPMFILFCILFALGIKKQNGAWSIEAQFSPTQLSGHSVPQQASWDYQHYPTQDQMAQTQQQQQQPQQQPQQQQQQQQQQAQAEWDYDPLGIQPPSYPQQDYARQEYIQQEYIQQHEQNGPYEMPDQARDELHSRSPPPHFEAMGLYHQANGMAPQAPPVPYDEKK